MSAVCCVYPAYCTGRRIPLLLVKKRIEASGTDPLCQYSRQPVCKDRVTRSAQQSSPDGRPFSMTRLVPAEGTISLELELSRQVELGKFGKKMLLLPAQQWATVRRREC